jgi:hypothetical protein
MIHIHLFTLYHFHSDGKESSVTFFDSLISLKGSLNSETKNVQPSNILYSTELHTNHLSQRNHTTTARAIIGFCDVHSSPAQGMDIYFIMFHNLSSYWSCSKR